MGAEQVVARFNDGRVLKGYVKHFAAEAEEVVLEEDETRKKRRIPVHELKALFFVKTFEGKSGRRDRKLFGIRENAGRKVYVRFKDGESLLGFLDGDVPWEKGFFPSRPVSVAKGFFLIPVDTGCNNDRIFVVGSSIKDITTFP